MAGAPFLQKFLSAAKYFIGLKETGNNSFTDPRGKELWRLWGYDASGTAWCAIFVSACAQKAGIAGKVISKDSYAIGVQYKTVHNCGGKWIDGPLINGGKKVTPIPGDLITFGNQQYHGHSHATHIGIVEYVSDGKVHTIEGNTSNTCARRSYSLSYSGINAYVRPDWSKVGDDISSYLSGADNSSFTPLYQDRNDRHDMTLRQVGYLDNSYALSNNSSGISISIINYTSALGDLYKMFSPFNSGSVKINTDNLSGNTKIVVDYLIKLGLSASSACAIAGCLHSYSSIDPASVFQKGTDYLYGIGAWNKFKLTEIKNILGETWPTNLSGQLDFLLTDIESNFNSLVPIIKGQSNDKEAVERIINVFMPVYNVNCNGSEYVDIAKQFALDTYNKLIITSSEIIGNSSKIIDRSGKQLTARKTITIPSSVPQTGIIDDYTSYSAWFSRWNGKSPQKKLANIWKDQGYPCSKGIATIGGYYCVAVRPKFGACGDVISVTLSNNTTFNAIICDEKGADAGSEWGHVKSGGKISVIEWQRVKTKNGKVVTGTGFTDVDACGFTSWCGKKVVSITNYGKYADVKWS